MFQPYPDVPAIIEDENAWLADQSVPWPQHYSANHYWAGTDPSLESIRMFECPNEHISNLQQHLYQLEMSATGQCQLMPLQIPIHETTQMGLSSPFPTVCGDYRPSRHVSPGIHGALSATDSTISESSWSPELIRHHPNLNQTAAMGPYDYSSPALEVAGGNEYSSWAPATLHIRDGSHSPYSTSNASACNLKEVQYSPDLSVEEENRELSGKLQPKLLVHDPEELALSSETASFADEGLGQSVSDETSCKDDSDDDENEVAQNSDDDAEYTPRKPSIRRPVARSPRRPRSLQTTTSITTILGTESRVTKSHHRRNSSTKSNTRPTTSGGTSTTSATKARSRIFPCTFSHYGCSSVFASKNEWKRHVTSQHLRLGFYRCDVGPCNPANHSQHDNNSSIHSNPNARIYNDFNRKDLFTQHHRRMHAPWSSKTKPSKKDLDEFDDTLEPVRQRCWIATRQPPSKSTCGVCEKEFDASVNSGWDERMEHLGKHFEKGEATEEKEDRWLTEWAIREGIVRDLGSTGKWLVGFEPPAAAAAATAAHQTVAGGGRRRRARGVKVEDEEEDD